MDLRIGLRLETGRRSDSCIFEWETCTGLIRFRLESRQCWDPATLDQGCN
jgi:hypothetical protein